MDGLSSKLRAVGILKNQLELHHFARAFGLNQSLFQFVDVGQGKERADHKLKETFRLFHTNIHCKHIIFAGIGHDFGYLPMLDPMKRDAAAVARISLLETWTVQPSFRQLGFEVFQAPSVFRAQPLPDRPSLDSGVVLPQRSALSPSIPVVDPAPIAAPIAKPNPPPTTSPTPSGGSEESTWARVSKAGAGAREINVASKKQAAAGPRFILLNAYDERLDAALPKQDTGARNRLFDRTNKKKVCNAYHIYGRCDNQAFCDYDHGERLTPSERLSLMYFARKRCCPYKSDCRDVKCLFGHLCPYQEYCTDPMDCYFRDVHHVERKAALKQYEDESVEVLAV